MRIFKKEVVMAGISSDVIEIGEITDEDSLELRAIASAVARLARFAKNTVRIDKIYDGRIRDQCCLIDISNIAGDLVEVRQSAENDALIVCPRRLSVVYAGTSQSVINKILAVNH